MTCHDGGSHSKLCPCALGMALGFLKGLFLILLAYAGWLGGYGLVMIGHIASCYHGYGASFAGGLIGGVYGLVSGFICGYLFGYFYNYILCHCSKKSAS